MRKRAKEKYIARIVQFMEDCEDIDLLDLILAILFKDFRKNPKTEQHSYPKNKGDVGN